MGGTPPQGTIASMLAKLKEAGNFDEHPGSEELLGALPLIAGAWLSASPRRGWQGVGNALAAAGGLAEYDATTRVNAKSDRDKAAKDAKAWNAFAGTMKPGESTPDVIKGATASGLSVPDALAVYKDYSQGPKEGTPQKVSMNGISGLRYPNGRTEWLSAGETAGAQGKETAEGEAYQQELKNRPGLTREQFHKEWGAASGKPPQPSWRWTTGPDGRAVQIPYSNVGGVETPMPLAGDSGITSKGGLPGKPNAQQQQLLDSVNTVEDVVPQLTTAATALPDSSPGRLAREYAKFRAPFGALGPADPAYVAYFSTIGQVKSDLTKAAMGAGRGKYLFDAMKQHIPSETDPPARAMEKMKWFQEGRFAAIRKTILGAPPDAAETAAAALPASGMSTAPPAPSFNVAKTYLKDGRWYVQDDKGQFYQYDGKTWQTLSK